MLDLSEEKIQEMIELARGGDPEANYRMFEWALDQAAADPEEERWNRLAAKCLTRSAEAGYAPAQERMDELIRQLEEDEAAHGEAPAAEPETKAAPTAERRRESAVPQRTRQRQAKPAKKESSSAGAAVQNVLKGIGAAALSAGTRFGGFVKEIFSKSEPSAKSQDGGEPPAEKGSLLRMSTWNDAQWKTMQRVCLILCAVIVVVIIIVLLSGKHQDKEPPEPEPTIPVAVTAQPVIPTATPEIVLYPDETTRTEIAAANMDVFPEDMDYIAAATTMTVSTSGSDLYVRRGNDSNYGQITSIPNGTAVEVYAMKGEWALVMYENNWGWCSTKYLK